MTRAYGLAQITVNSGYRQNGVTSYAGAHKQQFLDSGPPYAGL